MTTIAPEQIHEAVRERYGQIAERFTPTVVASDCCSPSSSSESSCCGPSDSSNGDCCGSSSLYEADLSNLPADVTGLSLGCGDPITLAGLAPGQTVLDLGSGGGIDCFLAARQVGESGRVIGVDMTPAMLAKAERNKAKVGLANVEFRQGQIEALPVEDDTVDVIVSNCVINLSPDKAAVFREAFRVLRPGGRLAVSDMVVQGRLSADQRANMSAWAACLTGAEAVEDYVGAIQSAGFVEISVRDKDAPQFELAGALSLPVSDPRIFSARVTAVKPG
jgi:arsenite methyltransferase